MRLQGKTALITGAAVGIGRAVALKFAAEGARVVAIDINEAGLKLLEKKLKEKNCEVLALVCDVSNEDSVNEAFAVAKERFGKIDILVNNAALWRFFSDFLDMPTDTWKKLLDVNVMSVVYWSRAVLPDMIESGWGRIINVASVAGVYGNGKMVAYSATKGALISMTKALANEK